MPSQATPRRPQSGQADGAPLVYAVELWAEGGDALEQVLARASSLTLARAIFAAAKQEHPGRRIILRHGDRELDKA
jgi:hypothetical protein